MKDCRRFVIAGLLAVVSATASPPAFAAVASERSEPWLPNPYPRGVWVGQELHRWDFETDAQGFVAAHDCTVGAAGGVLKIRSTGIDPYIQCLVEANASAMVVRLRMRQKTAGGGQLFWASTRHPHIAAGQSVAFGLIHDGRWHEYEVPMEIDGQLTALRLDPGTAAGDVEVDWIAVHAGGLHPLEITRVTQRAGRIDIELHNYGQTDRRVQADGLAASVPAGKSVHVEIAPRGGAELKAQAVTVESPGLPTIRRTVWMCDPSAKMPVERLAASDVAIELAQDGSMATIKRRGKPVAIIAPIVHRDFAIPKMKLTRGDKAVQLRGDGITADLALSDQGDVQIAIESDQPVEGPVVRAFGSLEQGLLAGVEYLGRGEVSSSKLDIETAEHLRWQPSPHQLTMPLMAFVTDRATVAMTWDDMRLEPTFAAPDFIDGTENHRMSLRGKAIRAILSVGPAWGEGGRLEAPILWAVRRRGLPEPPSRPRTTDEQYKLYRRAFDGGMVNDTEHGGWHHAVVPGRRKMPEHGGYFADCVSAIWKITGKAPDTPELQPGGGHIRNNASFFVTGRVSQWLKSLSGRTRQLVGQQQPDGAFRYDGKYRRGHFEDTASGVCARSASVLLEDAYYTGDKRALAAGLKTLEYMRRFRTPRGAQVWEVPLHTPDILAAAHLVWAYVRGYELTGERRWLDEARRWAISGLPFVYQWSDRPIMAYATTPVLGATNWVAPNWIGLPVQWCGTVYAYALLLLAQHDNSLDWRKVAEGITICGEQMVYPDGAAVGTLPDVFRIEAQSRHPADINPSALICLRARLDGQLDGLDRTEGNGHVVVAPYPCAIRDGRASITARPGAKYQVLIDGRRIVDVESKGSDVVELR